MSAAQDKDDRKERSAAVVDEEEEDSQEARLYAETRAQLQDLTRQLYAVQQQAAMNQRRIRRNQLTMAELAKYPEEVATYKPVGRLFMRQPNSAIQDELLAEDKQLEAEVESLQAKQAYLVKERESAERQLAELAGKLQAAQLAQ